tara:strand:+ start:623 stop:802 length:180 start_codon:yes stop_codon:yes gene_type:complete
MKTIKSLLTKYKSFYAAAKELGVNANQMQRWSNSGAKFDSNGQVWIKTAKPINGLKNED